MKHSRTRPLCIGYYRVSTDGQVVEGASLEAQRVALTAEADRRGWDLVLIGDEGKSAKTMKKRPGLTEALRMLDRGEADALMAVRLDRISRSLVDFAGLMERAKRRGWRLVLMSPDLDTVDPAGAFVTHVLAAAAQYESALTGVRTREGMAQKRAEGVHLGRSRALSNDVLQLVQDGHARGLSLRGIAADLTARGIPTAHGGVAWYASTIKAILKSFDHVAECPSCQLRAVSLSA